MSLLPSPITPELLVSGAIGIGEVVTDGDDIYWAEARPDEGGRTAIVRWRDSVVAEVTGSDVNVRTRVHEYGGGAWWVSGGRLVYSDDAQGGELFVLDVDGGTEAGPNRITSSGHRYADGRFTSDQRWYVCVREVHDGETAAVTNELVAVRTDGTDERSVHSGHDFYSSPRLSSDGQIVFAAWDHPNMPWDQTLLYVGTFNDGTVTAQRVASGDESLVQPDFGVVDRLLVVTDQSNWWNLVEIDPTTGERSAVVSGEFEIGTPGWVFGLSSWCDSLSGPIVVASTPEGDEIHFPDGTVESRHSAIWSLRGLPDGPIAYAASSYHEEGAVWIHDGSTATRLSTPRDLGLGAEWFPSPESISFDVTGVDPSLAPGTVAHCLFYDVANPEHQIDGPPPLLVLVHGGPTTAARRQLSLAIRFWTSRGVAVADVDYRGSTLYGREYRRALWGQWGHADVVDCVAAARYLGETGRVDSARRFIAGGSAGGLTVLNALAHHGEFSGGISRYGVADLSALAVDTHKFEKRYLDRLVGEWPAQADVYRDRSPLTHAHKITAPLLVLQGADDKVVPPSQSEAIVAALETNDVPVRHIVFEGEGHGFRRADTIIAALRAEEEFVQSL